MAPPPRFERRPSLVKSIEVTEATDVDPETVVVDPPPPPVAPIVIDPFEAEVITTLSPAIK